VFSLFWRIRERPGRNRQARRWSADLVALFFFGAAFLGAAFFTGAATQGVRVSPVMLASPCPWSA